MNGRTHEAVGVASALIAMHGAGRKEMIIGCLVASAAATIPDVDLIDNRKGQGIQMVVEVIKQSMIPIGFALYYKTDTALVAVWISMMIFLVLQPHRGFSHSVWSMGITAYLFQMMTSEELIPWYLIAYGSHLLVDTMNTKTVQILYPKGFCLSWVKSGGITDWVIGAIASMAIVAILIGRMQGLDMVQVLVKEVAKW